MLHEVRGQLEMVRSVVKWSGRARRPEGIPAVVRRAVAEMLSGRTLPVEVEIPPDVLAATSDAPAEPQVAQWDRHLPDPGDLERAVSTLHAARRPLIVAGGGAIR